VSLPVAPRTYAHILSSLLRPSLSLTLQLLSSFSLLMKEEPGFLTPRARYFLHGLSLCFAFGEASLIFETYRACLHLMAACL
jgi:hypothetical protein